MSVLSDRQAIIIRSQQRKIARMEAGWVSQQARINAYRCEAKTQKNNTTRLTNEIAKLKKNGRRS